VGDAAEIDEALIERREVVRIGQDGRRPTRARQQAVAKRLGVAAAIKEIIVMVGEAVAAAPSRAGNRASTSVRPADASGLLALELAPAFRALGRHHAETAHSRRRPPMIRMGAPRMMARAASGSVAACAMLSEPAANCCKPTLAAEPRHDRVDAQTFGRIEFFLFRDC